MDGPVDADNTDESMADEMNSSANLGTTEENVDVPCDRANTEIVIHFPRKTARAESAENANAESLNLSQYNDDYLQQLMIAVDELRQVGQFCNVILQAGSTKVPAHRHILASSSPYFYAMFTGSTKEASSECIEIQEMEGPILAQLIEFVYTGRITVTEENVQALLPAANLFQLLDVRDACGKFLESQLDATNCLGILRFSDLHNCTQLSATSRQFAEKNYYAVFKDGSEFLTLSAEELEKFITSDNLSVSEDQVFESILLWENHDPNEREKFAERLYKSVRFPLMSRESLVRLSQLKSFLTSKPWCKDYLYEAFVYQALSMEAKFSVSLDEVKKREGPTKALLVIGGTADGAPVRNMEFYNFKTQSWQALSMGDSEIASCVARKREYGVVAIGALVYVLGGYSYVGVSQSVDIYDANKNEWMSGPDMIQCRFGLGAAELNGKIYAIGGSNGVCAQDTVEVLDVASQRWNLIARMTTRRRGPGVATMNNKIYVVGGAQGVPSLESYDPSNDCWTTVTSLGVDCNFFSVCALDGSLYVLGGMGKNNVLCTTISVYSPESQKWVNKGNLERGFTNAGIVAHEGSMYIVGGQGDAGLLTSVRIYDPLKNTHGNLQELMKYGRLSPSVAVIELQRSLE